MMEGETVLGVLSLECDQLNGFDQDAEQALCAFAELAVIAIQNAGRYRELRETRATVGNITAVAWMGLVAGAWRHSIGNMATTISDLSLLAQTEMEKKEPPEKIIPRMKKIQEIVEEIQKIPMPPLSSEAGAEPIFICQLVRDRINQFKNKKERYGGITFDMTFEIDELSKVRASPEWLRRILDIMIDNASNAMKGRQTKRISLLASPRNKGIEILFSDTGTGIPEQLKDLLFKAPIIKKENEKGSGIGLFLANTVVQTFGGRLNIRSTGPDGTTLALWLPLSD
jgi:two-component system NtrC family sensor kinase